MLGSGQQAPRELHGTAGESLWKRWLWRTLFCSSGRALPRSPEGVASRHNWNNDNGYFLGYRSHSEIIEEHKQNFRRGKKDLTFLDKQGPQKCRKAKRRDIFGQTGD